MVLVCYNYLHSTLSNNEEKQIEAKNNAFLFKYTRSVSSTT